MRLLRLLRLLLLLVQEANGQILTIDRSISADQQERRRLKEIEQLIARSQPRLVGADGENVEIPQPLYEVLLAAAKALRQGKAVSIVPTSDELTTQQPADFLNVSRPFLIRLLDHREIPRRMVGMHRRISFDDLLRYRAKRSADRRKVLTQLTEEAQDLGIFED